jgi:hypothetical protein
MRFLENWLTYGLIVDHIKRDNTNIDDDNTARVGFSQFKSIFKQLKASTKRTVLALEPHGALPCGFLNDGEDSDSHAKITETAVGYFLSVDCLKAAQEAAEIRRNILCLRERIHSRTKLLTSGVIMSHRSLFRLDDKVTDEVFFNNVRPAVSVEIAVTRLKAALQISVSYKSE